MGRYLNPLNFGGTFNIKGDGPIDSRTVVYAEDDLVSDGTWTAINGPAYSGMTVSVISTGDVWVLKNVSKINDKTTGQGWVKIGGSNLSADSGITITNDKISVKIGNGLSFGNDGSLNASIGSLPIATKSTTGVTQIGDNINITANGVISVSAATNDTLGVVKPGRDLSVDENGVINTIKWNYVGSDILSFTSIGETSTIVLVNVNNNNPDIKYSTNDGETWVQWENYQAIILNDGDTVLFKGNNPNGLSSSSSKYSYFRMTGSLCADGNIMYLIDETGKSRSLSDKSYCFGRLFSDCTSLVSAPALPATTLADDCYSSMFQGCTSLVSAPELPATALESRCYSSMFRDCASLTTAPELPATTLDEYCCTYMFAGCTSLTTAPALPATTLANQCYSHMFEGCTSLTTAPELPATTLASLCYYCTFSGCTSLTTAPELPATALTDNCYSCMFDSCTGLTTAPELPATMLAERCYVSMFYGCASLTIAPELPATTLADACYRSMFRKCTNLTTAPVLPAITLADNCYNQMFYDCTALTAAPELPGATLVENCYQYMFKGCTNLNYIKCLATDLSQYLCTSEWVSGVQTTSGTFVRPASMASAWPTGIHGIPTNWTVQDATD